MLIQAWHRAQGNTRTKMLIPDTAHGTNPASAALCGFSSVKVPLGPDGILTVEDVAALMDDDCAGIMITNPNTLGLFESNIKEIAELVHARGGLVYGDGANLNAIMGYAHMGHIGIDVMHMNLHKTFSTPHGGGGPGSGAICVSKTLVPFLPGPRLVETDGKLDWVDNSVDAGGQSIGRMHPFWGQFGVVLRAWAYMKTLGPDLKRGQRAGRAQRELYQVQPQGSVRSALPAAFPARMRVHGQEAGRVRGQHDGHRQAPDRLRHPSADDLLPAGGARARS